MSKGILYGVGIGPGDPELLTLKAVRLIRENDVIAYPGKVREETVAYKIVKQAVPEIDEKESICIDFLMVKDKELLDASHDRGADQVCEILDQGRNVVFLTLGDPTIYATYLYIHKRVVARGYETEIVSGITSICAVAAKLNISLVERAEPLHVLPASYQIEDGLKLPGTKVLMKAASKMGYVKQVLKETGCEGMMIENCGMPGEKIYRSIDEIDENAGYYSVVIIKEKNND